MTKSKIIAVTAAILAAATALLLVVGVPANFLKERIRTGFEAETGYRLRIDGSATIGLWPLLAFAIHDVGVSEPDGADDAGRKELFKAKRIQLEISLASIIRGPVNITKVSLTGPTLYVPMARQRTAAREAGAPALPVHDNGRDRPELSRLTVEDGTVVLYDSGARTEQRFEGIKADASLQQALRRFDLKAAGNAGGQQINLEVKSAAPVGNIDAPFPVDFTIEAPGFLEAPISANATLAFAGRSLTVSALRGAIGPHALNGSIQVDFAATKPYIKAELNFDRLELAKPSAVATPPRPESKADKSNAESLWSDRELNFSELNYFDADVAFAASEFAFKKLRLVPLACKVGLANGVLSATLQQANFYDGQLLGSLVIDATQSVPAHAARVELDGVQAFPLLSDTADFSTIEGRLRASLDLRASGASPQAIITSLDGKADIGLRDGQIRGLNVADIVRSAMAKILTGWQEDGSKKTDFNQLNATFQLKDGQATTSDITLMGPLVRMRGVGVVDLLTKMLSFRLEPKLVASLEGQGGQDSPLGFGVPVIVQGSWSEPQIYPDIAGIRENPDAAFEKLRALGAGLAGAITGTGQKDDQKSNGNDIVKSLTDFFSDKKEPAKDAAPDKQQPGKPEAQDTAGGILRLFGK